MPSFADFDFVPLLLAVLLGGLIGLERELHGRPAGLRTHALVCVCATMLIQVAQTSKVPAEASFVFDPNRMGAGIVTGVGFLGAATVLRSGDLVVSADGVAVEDFPLEAGSYFVVVQAAAGQYPELLLTW